MKGKSRLSAKSLGYCSCHVCGLVSRPDNDDDTIDLCPRCHTTLHMRKTGSIERCWALLLASAILYVPANTLIMMETGTLISYRKDTILSGVVHLWVSGSWFVAAIVFVASIVVPLFKIIALALLLISVQRRSTRWIPQRARLYRLVEAVGRWSMLDIFVVTLLAALVQIRSLAIVKAGPAAIAFGAVVVLTMLAAMAFDSRLIWDPIRKEKP